MFDEAIECFSQVIQINDNSIVLPHEVEESTFEQWFLVALIYTFCAVRAHLFTCCTHSGNFELGHQVFKEGLPIVHSDSEDLLSVACKSYIHTYIHIHIYIQDLYVDNALYGYSLCLLKKFTEAVSHLRYCLAVCPRSKEGESVLLRSNCDRDVI